MINKAQIIPFKIPVYGIPENKLNDSHMLAIISFSPKLYATHSGHDFKLAAILPLAAILQLTD